MAEIGVYIPAQVFLCHPLVDPLLLLGGVSGIWAALHSFGVNPGKIAFSCVRHTDQLSPPYERRPWVPPFLLLVALLITLTGAIRGRGTSFFSACIPSGNLI